MKFFIKFYNLIIKILANFVINKNDRKYFAAKYSILRRNNTNTPYLKSKIYKKIYYPKYSKNTVFNSSQPEIYNKNGSRLTTLYFRSDTNVIGFQNITGEYLFSDKYNIALDYHLYADTCMLEKMGNPKKCYGIFSEPKAMSPLPYAMFEQNKDLYKDFDLIFAHSEKVLDTWDNARPFAYFTSVWHMLSDENGNLAKDWYEKKTKDISIVSSNKQACTLHKFRYELAKKCKREHLADTYGTFDGGRLVNVEEYLDNYRYSIVVENDIEAYWFTEKIVNCFATMTIPVYIGATKIGEFFNEDGIIRITEKDFDNIDKILKQCTKEEYEARIDILKENFEKSKQFCGSSWDRLYKKYLKEDLEK